MLSFWEKEHFLCHDYLVVGGGIVGLSAAASIKEKHPDSRVLILERGVFPTGASTKNAGFACFGSMTELLADIETMGVEESMQLVQDRWLGLQKLRSRLGDDHIGLVSHGGYEIIREKESYCLEQIDTVNEKLSFLFDSPVFSAAPEAIGRFGFNRKKIKSIIYNPYEGQIDTGKMMQSLMHHVQKLGVTMLTGAEVVDYMVYSDEVRVLLSNQTEFRADKLIICTNAFTPRLLPDLDISPGRGIVLVTQPIRGLKFKGVFHYDQGYYYFRNYGDRVIFGGGRNLDVEGETTDRLEINEQILDVLKKELQLMILPRTPFEVDHVWSGIMAFGQSKQPLLKKVGDRVILGVRLGGMGVAIGSNMGERICEIAG